MARKLLWASLALAPITFVVDFAFHPGDVALFVLAAASLVPLAWLIGESTEQASEHTGPGIGGFLNASFGNAPELIIALFAVADALPNVVRGSLAGSVISNLLLVLGVAMATGESGKPINRNSLLLQLGLVATAVLLFLAPSVAGWHGNPERRPCSSSTSSCKRSSFAASAKRTPNPATKNAPMRGRFGARSSRSESQQLRPP